MGCNTTCSDVFLPIGIFVLMFQNSSGTMSASLENIDRVGCIKVTPYNECHFKFFSEKEFRLDKHVHNFFVVNITLFFQSTCKSLSNIFSVKNKNIGSSSFLLSLLIVLRCCLFSERFAVTFSFQNHTLT